MDKKAKFMPWIKEFSKSITNFFKGQVIGAMQPIDFYLFFPLWYVLWIIRVASLVKKLNLEDKNFSAIKDSLPPPSNFRTILKKLIVAYRGNPTERDSYRVVADFLARMLQESCKTDPFALTSNPLYSNQEFDKLIQPIKFQEIDESVAKKIGQLITAAGSLVHGLYNDVVTDFGWDSYGPYNVRYLGQNYSALVRHFLHLRPVELWPEEFLPSIQELKIFSLYQEIEWKIYFFGCHTISSGKSPVEAMKRAVLFTDGRPVAPEDTHLLIEEFAQKATNLYKKIKQMDFEDLKLLIMRQECYQFKALFDVAGVDWQPTNDMIMRIKNKPLLKGIFPQETFIDSEEKFSEIFGIDKFSKEVLGEKQ
jgi:hypothetical protein